jgi:hypothetical protein
MRDAVNGYAGPTISVPNCEALPEEPKVLGERQRAANRNALEGLVSDSQFHADDIIKETGPNKPSTSSVWNCFSVFGQEAPLNPGEGSESFTHGSVSGA